MPKRQQPGEGTFSCLWSRRNNEVESNKKATVSGNEIGRDTIVVLNNNPRVAVFGVIHERRRGGYHSNSVSDLRESYRMRLNKKATFGTVLYA